ncbi:DMT family transporter [Amycolatopsis rhizosphaerae]|uniref:DMT family transporter n=1 Tax=Amycolatopsis rhizosphaerae TaxID=2053003 RepID=A0A558CSM7_9PSEU|nr:DMT family transporter [Amycolatopsis rhizosphaerae]TVT51777.1 DMT family transporter [Amycolatopsis rhizosphaerae]
MEIVSRARSLFTGICAMALVGSSVGVSRTLTTAPLLTAQALRYALASLILLGLAKLTGAPIRRPRGREWLWLAGVAASGLVLFNVAVVHGVAHAEPAVAVACVPVVLGLAGPLLERRRPSRRVLAAAAVVTAGSVLVAGIGRADAAGIGWAVVTLLCEAGFTLLAVPVLPRHGAWGVSLHSVWMGAAMLLVLGLVTEGEGAAASLTPIQWASIGYLAVLVTAVAFLLWYSTVAALGSDRVGLLTGVAPVAAALAGGGPSTPFVWFGIAVVVAGLAVGLGTPALRRRATRSGEPRNQGRGEGDLHSVTPGRSAAPPTGPASHH